MNVPPMTKASETRVWWLVDTTLETVAHYEGRRLSDGPWGLWYFADIDTGLSETNLFASELEALDALRSAMMKRLWALAGRLEAVDSKIKAIKDKRTT